MPLVNHSTKEFTADDQSYFDQLKKVKREQIAAERYAEETGGITLSGMNIATDRQSQAMINGVVTAVTLDETTVIDWKVKSGWVQLDKTAVMNIASAVTAHVQACFTKEKDLNDLIDTAATPEDIEAVTW